MIAVPQHFILFSSDLLKFTVDLFLQPLHSAGEEEQYLSAVRVSTFWLPFTFSVFVALNRFITLQLYAFKTPAVIA